MSNFLADKGYIALKPQTDATTPIVPTFMFPLVSETVKVNPNFSTDRRLKGLDFESDALLRGSKSVEGQIVVLADPEVLGHLLNMNYAKGSTTGNGTDGYTHPFTPGEGKSYSIDIPRGDFAVRLWGVRGERLRLQFQDNKLQATQDIKALGHFYSASLAVALTGAGMTSAVLSIDGDPRPADGLCVGDVIKIGSVSVALTSVNADGKTVGFASTAITASVGDPVFLLAQTPSLGTVRDPFYLGGTLVGVAATSALADTAAASRATATPCYEISVEIMNNTLSAPASGYTGPAAILNQVKSGTLEISRLFTDPTPHQKWLEAVKQAVTIIVTGKFIKSDLSTSEKLTLKLHKLELTENDEPLDAGQYIFDKQKFQALYDSVDAKAIEVELVNRTAGTSY